MEDQGNIYKLRENLGILKEALKFEREERAGIHRTVERLSSEIHRLESGIHIHVIIY